MAKVGRKPPDGMVVRGSTAKVVFLSGPRSGEEFPLVDDEVVVGRSSENAISVPDTSVSRKHVLLRRVAGGWSARDLGSGNGTLLNGQPMADETTLRNNDVLTCGETEFSFVDLAEPTERRPFPKGPERSSTVVPAIAEPEPPTKSAYRRRLWAYGAIFVVLVAGLGAGFYVKQRRKAAATAELHLAEAAASAQTGGLFQEAKALVRQNRWVEALPKLKEIKESDPQNTLVDDYLRAAEREIPIQQTLDEAEAALGNNELGQAQAELDKVPKDTPYQFERVSRLSALLEERISGRMADALRMAEVAAKVSGPKDPSKWVAVVNMTSDILAARPDHRDAKALNEQARLSIRRMSTRTEKRAPPEPRPWEESLALFSEGEVKEAMAVAKACAASQPRCKALSQQLTEFDSLSRKVDELDVKGLEQLLALDNKITEGKPSKAVRALTPKFSAAFYRSAQAAKAAGQWAKAQSFASKTLKVDPTHAGAQATLAELRGKAKELYLQGYSVKDANPEEAIRLFRDVVAMTPPDDESHRKARQRLDALTK